MSMLKQRTQPPERVTNVHGVQEKQGLGGHTCLHLAVMSDKVEIVQMLLNSGADGAAVADVSYLSLIILVSIVSNLMRCMFLAGRIHRSPHRGRAEQCRNAASSHRVSALSSQHICVQK